MKKLHFLSLLFLTACSLSSSIVDLSKSSSLYIKVLPDPSFGATYGKTITNFNGGTYNEKSYSLAQQADGKYLSTGSVLYNAGQAKFLLIRYNTDGTVDNSFGTAGPGYLLITIENTPDFIYYDFGYAMKIQPDGKMILFGDSNNKSPLWNDDLGFARLNSNGSYDLTFGVDGKLQVDFGGDEVGSSGSQIAIQGDGKYVACGHSSGSGSGDTVIARLSTAGALDTSFNGTGKLTLDVSRMVVGVSNDDGCSNIAIQNLGGSAEKILAAGNYVNGSKTAVYVTRLLSNGSTDTSFGRNGYFTSDSNSSIGAIYVDASQRIYIIGTINNGSNNDFLVLRLNPDGNLDTSFGTGGKFQYDFGGSNDAAKKMAYLSSGEILIGGTSDINGNQDLAFVLLTPNGQKVNNFVNSSGQYTIDVGGTLETDELGDMMINSSDEVVIVGSSLVSGISSNTLVKLKITH